MKKLIIFAVIILATVLIGAPFVTGKVAETQITTMLNQINSSPELTGNNELLSYERSAFSTHAELRYTLPGAYQALTNLEYFDYQCHLDHGAIGIDYSCKLSENSEYQKFIDTYFSGKDPIVMNGEINAFGDITHTISIDELNDFSLQGSDDSISMSKSTLTIETDKDLLNHRITGNLDNLTLSSSSESMSASNLEIDSDISKLGDNLFVGDFNAEIKDLQLPGSGNDININGFSIKTNAHENGENLESNLSVSLQELSAPSAGAQVGTIENVNFTMGVGGLNTEAFSAYQEFALQAQKQSLSGNPSQGPAIAPTEIVPYFEAMLQ